MANWQITQTQQVGNTTINTWQNVPSLADITAEFNRKQAQRLIPLAPDVCPVCEGSGKSFAPLFSSDEACPACNGQNAGKA